MAPPPPPRPPDKRAPPARTRRSAAAGPAHGDGAVGQHVGAVGDVERGRHVLLHQQDRLPPAASAAGSARRCLSTICGASPSDGSSSSAAAAPTWSARAIAQLAAAGRPNNVPARCSRRSANIRKQFKDLGAVARKIALPSGAGRRPASGSPSPSGREDAAPSGTIVTPFLTILARSPAPQAPRRRSGSRRPTAPARRWP